MGVEETRETMLRSELLQKNKVTSDRMKESSGRDQLPEVFCEGYSILFQGLH